MLPALSGHAGSVQSVAFKPDGRQVLTTSQDDTVRLWTGTARDGYQPDAVLRGHTHLGGAAFTADGGSVLSYGGGTLHVWQAWPQPERGVIGSHGGWVAGAAYSPDGQRLVTYARGGTALLWSSSGGPALQLAGHRSDVIAAGFSADNTRVVAVSPGWQRAPMERQGRQPLARHADGARQLFRSQRPGPGRSTLADEQRPGQRRALGCRQRTAIDERGDRPGRHHRGSQERRRLGGVQRGRPTTGHRARQCHADGATRQLPAVERTVRQGAGRGRRRAVVRPRGFGRRSAHGRGPAGATFAAAVGRGPRERQGVHRARQSGRLGALRRGRRSRPGPRPAVLEGTVRLRQSRRVVHAGQRGASWRRRAPLPGFTPA